MRECYMSTRSCSCILYGTFNVQVAFVRFRGGLMRSASGHTKPILLYYICCLPVNKICQSNSSGQRERLLFCGMQILMRTLMLYTPGGGVLSGLVSGNDV